MPPLAGFSPKAASPLNPVLRGQAVDDLSTLLVVIYLHCDTSWPTTDLWGGGGGDASHDQVTPPIPLFFCGRLPRLFLFTATT
jgi:hypothetical protein